MHHPHRYPPLGQRLTNTALAVALFLPLFVAVLAVQRQDRKTGGTR